jgi:hypothetical protein
MDLGGNTCMTFSTESDVASSVGESFRGEACHNTVNGVPVLCSIDSAYLFGCTDFIVHVTRHVTPYFQAVFWLFGGMPCRRCFLRVGKASLLTPGIAGRFTERLVSAPVGNIVARGDEFAPSRIRRRFLLHFLDTKLTKMCHFSRLTMIAWPFARALVVPLAFGRRRACSVGVCTRCLRR